MMRSQTRLLLFISLLFAFAAVAQTSPAPAAPSIVGTLLSGFLASLATPQGMASIVAIVGAIVLGVLKLSDLRKQQLATAIHYAFHAIEDISATTGNTVDDKVAVGLGLVDAYLDAHGWHPLKPAEVQVAKMGFTSLNGQMAASAKVLAAASPK